MLNDVDALKHLVLENSTALQRAQVLAQQLELEDLSSEPCAAARCRAAGSERTNPAAGAASPAGTLPVPTCSPMC